MGKRSTMVSVKGVSFVLLIVILTWNVCGGRSADTDEEVIMEQDDNDINIQEQYTEQEHDENQDENQDHNEEVQTYLQDNDPEDDEHHVYEQHDEQHDEQVNADDQDQPDKWDEHEEQDQQNQYISEHQRNGDAEFIFFRMHDFDENHLLDSWELLSAFTYTIDENEAIKMAGSSEVDSMIGVIDNVLDSHDGNHDGYLSFHEFKGASKVYNIISE